MDGNRRENASMKRKPPSSMLESEASRFLQRRRGRPSYRTAPPAGRAARKILQPLAKRFGLGVEQFRQNWTDIVGARLANWSEPQSVQRAGGAQILVIKARGPAAAIIQAEAKRIVERLRHYAGKQAPTRIRVVQGMMRQAEKQPTNVTPPPSTSHVSEGVEQTAEARLLSALKRFDRHVQDRTVKDRSAKDSNDN
jgi:hypothetical protein